MPRELSETCGHPNIQAGSPFLTSPDTAAYMGAWAEKFSIAALLLTSDTRLLWANSAATALLAKGDHFTLADQRVTCVDGGQRADFRAFVANLTDDASAWICRGVEGALLAVRGEVVAPEDHAPGVALMMRPADATAQYIWADFGGVLGLTRAEAIIVKRMVSGHRADAIAEELSVTLETVRTHIKRIYQKLDVGSREQLFSQVSHFRIS